MKKTKPDTMLPARTCEDVSGNPIKRGRKTIEARLNDIIASERRLAEAKRTVMAEQRAAARARKESLERMIGAACMADQGTPDTFAAVRAALDRYCRGGKDRTFLRAEGWLSSSPPAGARESNG